MALINCSECTRQVSDKAATCPQCGAPLVPARAQPDNANSVRRGIATHQVREGVAIFLVLGSVTVAWIVGHNTSVGIGVGFMLASFAAILMFYIGGAR